MNLNSNQFNALMHLNDAVDEGLRRGLIFLKGAFQSGKSNTLFEFMKQRQLDYKEICLNLNQFLLFRLQSVIKNNPGFTLEHYSRLNAKTTLLFESYLSEYLKNFFEHQSLLVIDAIEILYKYPLNLPQVLYPYCRNGNIIIIAIPIDTRNHFTFDWNFNLAKIIEIEQRY